MKAIVEIRSQRAKHGGPDRYVAVQVVPEGVEPLRVLNHSVAAKRGIQIIHCGEGYSLRCKTLRSMLGSAIADAQRIANNINGIPSN